MTQFSNEVGVINALHSTLTLWNIFKYFIFQSHWSAYKPLFYDSALFALAAFVDVIKRLSSYGYNFPTSVFPISVRNCWVWTSKLGIFPSDVDHHRMSESGKFFKALQWLTVPCDEFASYASLSARVVLYVIRFSRRVNITLMRN